MKKLLSLSIALLSMIVSLAGCNKSEEIGGLEGTYVSLEENPYSGAYEKDSVTFLPNGHMITTTIMFDGRQVYYEANLTYIYRLKGTTIQGKCTGGKSNGGEQILLEKNEGEWTDVFYIQGDGTIKDEKGIDPVSSSKEMLEIFPSWGIYHKVTN